MSRLFYEFKCAECESNIYSTKPHKTCPVCEQRAKEKENVADAPTPYRPYWGTPTTDNLIREAMKERYKTLQEEALERYHKSKTKTLTFLELMSQADEDFKELARKWSQAQGKDDDACTLRRSDARSEKLESAEKHIENAIDLVDIHTRDSVGKSHIMRALNRAAKIIHAVRED